MQSRTFARQKSPFAKKIKKIIFLRVSFIETGIL